MKNKLNLLKENRNFHEKEDGISKIKINKKRIKFECILQSFWTRIGGED